MDSKLKLIAFMLLVLAQAVFVEGVFSFKKRVVGGLLLLGGITLISELLGFPGVRVGRVFWLGLMLVGLTQLIRRRPEGFRLAMGPTLASSVALVFLFSLALWMWLLRDLAGLPSVDDGAHHLFFYARSCETRRR